MDAPAHLEDGTKEHLSTPTDKGVNAGLKAASLVAGMVAGADSIEDMALLRHGGMGKISHLITAPDRCRAGGLGDRAQPQRHDDGLGHVSRDRNDERMTSIGTVVPGFAGPVRIEAVVSTGIDRDAGQETDHVR